MEETIKTIENVDGVRLTWNIWPTSAAKSDAIPIACMYNIHQEAPCIEYEPTFCTKCKSILCPYAIIDYGNKSWTCIYCNNRNFFNSSFRDASMLSELPEIQEQNSTMEYILSKTTNFSPIFVLLIDVCTYDSSKHEFMKSGLLHTIGLIPDDALVAVVLFGSNISLVSFAEEEIPSVYLFSGKVAYSKEIYANLNIHDTRNFVVKKSEKLQQILDLVNNLEMDPFPVMHGYKQIRCTGSALSLATSLIEGAFYESSVKYLLFTQGPCTYGPGKVSMLKISNLDEEVNLDDAKKFYSSLADKLNTAGHSIDLIIETFVDVGIVQMKNLVSATGGNIIKVQDFVQEIKTGSLSKIFESKDGILKMGFNAEIQVITSPNLAYKATLGDGKAFGKGWKVGSILPRSNISFLFENTPSANNNDFGYIQIITKYQRSDKKIVIKITSLSRMFSNDIKLISDGFDQEAACVFQARMVCLKDYLIPNDAEIAIDKVLIKFVRRYGNFLKDSPSSVTLPASMSYFPNFMFFFRRSVLIQRDGISPDERAYYKILLFKLMIGDAIKLIKPSLISYHYQGNRFPVELDTKSLSPYNILVLDSFHNVLIWRGFYVADWIDKKCHEDPEYAFFKDVINSVDDYVLSLMDRVPVPLYRETNEGGSQERILLYYINPSQNEITNTDKIDYARFYDSLCKLVVRSE